MKALAFFLGVPFLILSAHESNGRGTKAIAVANAFVALSDNPWAVSYNPAGLAQIRSPVFASFYVPQQFGVLELKTIAASTAIPFNFGTVGAFVEQFGFDLYRTTNIGLGCGFDPVERISVGATIDVEEIEIERYGVSRNVTLDVGFLGKPSANLAIGFCIKNVTAATIGTYRERLPQYVLMGASYSPFKGFSLVAELEKDIQFPLVVKVGIEQNVFEFLSLRCGIADNPDKFSAGMAVRYASVEFGYAGYSHPDLGWTHQIEVTIQWDR